MESKPDKTTELSKRYTLQRSGTGYFVFDTVTQTRLPYGSRDYDKAYAAVERLNQNYARYLELHPL